MNKNISPNNQIIFESIKHIDRNGKEYWLARELMLLLEYSQWRNFNGVIEKARIACEESKNPIDSNFASVSKSVKTGVGDKMIGDYKLTRYACYLIAMNGDSSKKVVALAQTYFATQTRKQEIANQNLDLNERKNLRKQSKESYKSYSSTLVNSGVNKGQIGIITSMGGRELFGKKTAKIKEENSIPGNRPLEDFLHPANVTARMLGREMTKIKAETNKIETLSSAISIHTKHNKEIRQVLLDNDIKPEELSVLEDINGLETKQKPPHLPTQP